MKGFLILLLILVGIIILLFIYSSLVLSSRISRSEEKENKY